MPILGPLKNVLYLLESAVAFFRTTPRGQDVAELRRKADDMQDHGSPDPNILTPPLPFSDSANACYYIIS